MKTKPMPAENVTLLEVVENLEHQDGELTIYASRPFTSDSRAVVARQPQGGGAPPEATVQGAEYFLDIFVAREFLEGGKDTKTSSLRDQCVGLIRYALTDAWRLGRRNTSMGAGHVPGVMP